jgi:hypothetical protein
MCDYFYASINALWKNHNELMFNKYSNFQQNWLLQIANQMQIIVESIAKLTSYIDVVPHPYQMGVPSYMYP